MLITVTQDSNDAGNSDIAANKFKNTVYCHYGLLILQLSRVQKQRMEMKSLMGIMDLLLQAGAARANSTNKVNTASTPVNTASTTVNTASLSRNIPSIDDIYKVPNDRILTSASYDDEGAVANFINLESTLNMDVKSAFLYGKIDEDVYVSQPPSFIDPKFPKKDKRDIMLVQVYVDDIIFGSTKKSWCDEFEALMKTRFQMSSMGELTFFLGLQTVSTPIETKKPLVKDAKTADVDVHLYRSMIGSLMYLTASRPDIMYAVCACSRFQVTPKTSHLYAVKRIFKYLKGKPKLGLWYPRESAFDLEAYSDSDYAGANLNRKSTTKGCQFLGRRLISWQRKKQTNIATSTTEAEYVAAASCCGQVLWIQNQMLDYAFSFMNTKIYIDNESTICIVKNPVFHSKTKHTKIRHHFIRDAYEKKLIYVLKVHTDDNVADRLTKAFDVSRFNFLIVNIEMLNL
nr:hypothetical protein [Tanacetum cinerariifolium]